MKTTIKKNKKVKVPATTIEEDLIASEIRYRRLFESAKDGILILEAETGKIIDVNPFLTNLLGFSKEEFVEKKIWEIGFFKDITANKDKFIELIQQEYVRYENLPLETIEGHKISVEFVSNVYLENHRKIIQCNIRDITERKKNEKDLIDSEILRLTLLQTIPDLIWLKDKEGKYLSCNKMFSRFFGGSETEIVGKTDYDFVDAKLADFFRDNDRKAMEGGKTRINEEWIRFADDGHLVYLETIKAPMYDSHDELIGVLGIGRDITLRKKAEDALLESEIKYRSFFETNMDAIFLTSGDGKTFSVNKAACEMFGYSTDELIKMGRSGVEDKSDSRLSDLLAELLLKGKAKGEVTFIHKNGTRFPTEVSATLFKNGEGINRTSLVIHNIAERKRVEKELMLAIEKAEESDRLKSAFLANMSHEIRTPMNGILGFTELLKEPMLTGDVQKEYINIIEKSGVRLLSIIDDLVSISKVDSGLMEVSVSETNVNDQIEFVYNFFKPSAEYKKIYFSYNNTLSEKEAKILTDSQKIIAILTNLVNNAIKFTSNGSIEFGYEKKGSWLEFYVRDTGIGVPEEQREIIFERFRQGSEALTRNYEGAGLGLSISKAYVEMIGGSIWFISNSSNQISAGLDNNKGSTFFFTIPYHPAEIVNPLVKNTDLLSTNKRPAKQLKILIVDDDEISELLISITVKKISSNILKVRTGLSAIEACRKNPDIDLIFMDIKMPVMDGYEATRKIRKFNKNVMIIAQTAYGLPGDREKALEAGCNDYVSKPVKIALLNKIVKNNLIKYERI